MPTRILREGILTSPRVIQLSWPAEVFYRRLMSVVDDFGRYHAHLTLLRAACYPHPSQLEKVSDSDVGKWIGECRKAALVRVYEVASVQYLEMLDFRQQQRGKSKFPEPPDKSAKQLLSECKADEKQSLSLDVVEVEGDISPPPGFILFWTAWPKSFRKQARGKCLSLWRKKKLEGAAAEIIAHVEACKSSDQWREEKYIPAPLVYLNGERWDGAEAESGGVKVDG